MAQEVHVDGKMDSSGAALSLRDVSKSYQGPAESVAVLRHVHLTVHYGEMVVVTGPPGSGKSTLLSLCASFLRPTSGDVWLCSVLVSHAPEYRLAGIRRDVVGFLFQDFQLVRGLSAAHNVALALAPTGLPPSACIEAAMAALNNLGLGNRAKLPVNYLSGGEQQRVALARALIRGPRVVFADEPTASVDSQTGRFIMDLLDEQKHRGAAVLVASHDPEVISADCVDRRHSLDVSGTLR